MINKFRLPVKGCTAQEVFENNGYIRKAFEDIFPNYNKAIEFLKNNGIVATFHSVYLKDNHICLFSNWEGNEYNQMVAHPKYIEVYDVTMTKAYCM